MNTSSFGVEKGTLIKQPAISNLMVDSADRDESRNPSPFDFQIARRQTLLSGFFGRIATTEVVVEWCQNNINAPQNRISLDVSGFVFTTTIAPGIYNVAQAVDAIIAEANRLLTVQFAATAPVLSVVDLSGGVVIKANNNVLLSVPDNAVNNPTGVANPNLLSVSLAERLDVTIGEDPEIIILINCPDLRPYRYMDIVCEDLTSVQDAKDATTQLISRDVLCRWYFSEDTPGFNDSLGFPILMGYERYCRRRIFNPPKQIKWEQNTNIGNLTFRCYDPDGDLLVDVGAAQPQTNFLMTLQCSEG
jgi:hypothetical protein